MDQGVHSLAVFSLSLSKTNILAAGQKMAIFPLYIVAAGDQRRPYPNLSQSGIFG